MLKIYLGNMEKAIYHPPTYFDNQMSLYMKIPWLIRDLLFI